MKPFLRWAGGKASLLPQLAPLLPKGPTNTYWEPFLGGGAMFFHMRTQGAASQYVLSDANPLLMQTWRAVRDGVNDLILQLQELKARHSPDFYEWVRRDFNAEYQIHPLREAYFIYLNKTCFNGLWRTNRKGEFNVPLDKAKKSEAILDAEGLQAASLMLGGVALRECDFTSIYGTEPGDFVFIDSPYVPVNKTSNFTSYTKDGFGPADYKRLAAWCRGLANKGVKFMAMNSDTLLVRELYAGFHIETIQARRNINSKGDKRGHVNELVIRNYTEG